MLVTAAVLKTDQKFKVAIRNLGKVNDKKGSYISKEEERH